jgi:RNA polymerase sigma-70 factor (family 1)
MSPSLQEIAQNLQKGCRSSFEKIYELYHGRVFGFCVKYGLDPSDAEEVTQEVFVKIWEARKQLDPERNIQSYILTIARNVAVDSFKAKIKEQATRKYQMSYLESGFNNIEEAIDYQELQATVENVMMRIPEKRRKVFELSRIKGLSHKEISRELGISTKTVENHIALALQDFRLAFGEKKIVSVAALIIVLSTVL